MSKKRDRAQKPAAPAPKAEEPKSSGMQQNEKPKSAWSSFEQCWHECVQGGNPMMMNACIEHLRSLKWLDKPEKWIDGIIHFGIEVEK